MCSHCCFFLASSASPTIKHHLDQVEIFSLNEKKRKDRIDPKTTDYLNGVSHDIYLSFKNKFIGR